MTNPERALDDWLDNPDDLLAPGGLDAFAAAIARQVTASPGESRQSAVTKIIMETADAITGGAVPTEEQRQLLQSLSSKVSAHL